MQSACHMPSFPNSLTIYQDAQNLYALGCAHSRTGGPGRYSWASCRGSHTQEGKQCEQVPHVCAPQGSPALLRDTSLTFTSCALSRWPVAYFSPALLITSL